MTIWTRLDDLFAKHPTLKASGVPDSEIAEAESALGKHFSDDYRKFLRRYGAGIVGPLPVMGLRHAAPMGEDFWNVVEVTRVFWAQTWPGTSDWYIISVDGSGNPIGIDGAGRVWISDHDTGEVEVLADDFLSWLGGLL